MLAARRRATIIERVRRDHEVRVSSLSQLLQVSEETIRRDLAILEQEGMVERNHGGAILRTQPATVRPYSERQMKNYAERRAIAQLAAALIKPRSVVMLDAGTTTGLLAEELLQHPGITVITHALPIAAALSEHREIELLVAGGKVNPHNQSMTGPFVESALTTYNAGQVFLGTSGITLEQGLTTSDIYEAEVKKAMLRPGREVIVLADHTKIGRVAMVTFANAQQIQRLITSELADREITQQLREAGIQVDLCPVPEEGDDEVGESMPARH